MQPGSYLAVMKKILIFSLFLGLIFLYFPVQSVSSDNGLPLDVRMESLNDLAGRFSGEVELSNDAIEGEHSIIVHTTDDPYGFANYYPTPQSEIDTDVYRYVHVYVKPKNNAQWVKFHVWDVSDERWENITSDLRSDGTFKVGEELISNQWNSIVLDLKQTNYDGVDTTARELHLHTNEFADWQWDHIYTKEPKFTKFGLLGAVGIQGISLDEILNNPIPGVKTLVMNGPKSEIDRAHELGYFVVSMTTGPGEPPCRETAQTGADVLITDEIVLWNNYPEGLQEAVVKFNDCRKAAKEANPNILVGDVEPFWEFLKVFMENGAHPDFVGGEVYNGDIDLERLNQLKQEYGVKTHQWLHGVEPDRDLKYIGQTDLAIFADVFGYWDCMNQDCPPYLEELRRWASTLPFSLSPGWNQITWPDVSGKKASDIPAECLIAVSKENFWFKPYVKNFGGVNFDFEKNKTYYIKCNQETIWQL